VIEEKKTLELCRECKYVVDILATFHTPEYALLAFEFLPGGDLYFHIMNSDNNVFCLDDVLFYTAQITEALDFIHAKQIIYRYVLFLYSLSSQIFSDLKLDNIVLDSEGYVKLVDFGLAKSVQNTNGKSTTFCYRVEMIFLYLNMRSYFLFDPFTVERWSTWHPRFWLVLSTRTRSTTGPLEF
jgi:serine/threonine protein kinase